MSVIQNVSSNPPQPKTTIVWMERPRAVPSCPPGLEYLTMLDGLEVTQEVCYFEGF